ncbi:ABC transporter substrate-binding protein [Comamonas serinivorans]|uniref:ABC transporter substrate-binding protein n=1 Tax=Comamonas serinivorans TaxID=1082851 RepID=A0A1Y0ENB4_9BURK|nr:tripartite tricarboxylate transporter substrate binding protein [Comamonas serinivorans]ARU04799.1 ABC transporter substrate-binding protein [Comamonas serinivorans]
MKKWMCVALLASSTLAWAQADFPNKPVKLLVPYAPGGSTDVLARALAKHLATELKQPVVVENKPGANTRIAATAAARSPADGYTLFMASNASMVLNPLLYKNLSYSTQDLTVTNILVEAPLVLVTNPATQIKTLAQLQAYNKANPGKLNYASVGLGNPLQLATEMIKTRLKIDATHVPFNGSAPALQGLMANDTQLMLDVVGTSLPHIRAGKLVALATTGTQRSAYLPDTPTVAESGWPGFQAATWFGVAVPAATPPAVKSTLQQAIDAVMRKREFNATVISQFLAPKQPQTAEQLQRFLQQDSAKWRKVIQDNQIALDN